MHVPLVWMLLSLFSSQWLLHVIVFLFVLLSPAWFFFFLHSSCLLCSFCSMIVIIPHSSLCSSLWLLLNDYWVSHSPNLFCTSVLIHCFVMLYPRLSCSALCASWLLYSILFCGLTSVKWLLLFTVPLVWLTSYLYIYMTFWDRGESFFVLPRPPFIDLITHLLLFFLELDSVHYFQWTFVLPQGTCLSSMSSSYITVPPLGAWKKAFCVCQKPLLPPHSSVFVFKRRHRRDLIRLTRSVLSSLCVW